MCYHRDKMIMIDQVAIFIILLTVVCRSLAVNVTALACERNPKLPYCSKKNKEGFTSQETEEQPEIGSFNREPNDLKVLQQKEEGSDQSNVLEAQKLPSTIRPPSISPQFPELFYSIYPNLLPKDDPVLYCAQSQYQFQVTCLPGKKLRYDLMMFCEQYSDLCGIPNINNYPSLTGRDFDDGRPYGHGQKQTNGAIGVGDSFALGLGPVPGFEVVGSRGVDVGPVPLVDQMGGFIINKGADLGILGERVGLGPARKMPALANGLPLLDSSTSSSQPADAKIAKQVLRSLGLGKIPGLGPLLGGLGLQEEKPKIKGYEPGYGAVDKKALIATGKTDTDSVSLPAFLGDFVLNKGIGLGIGK